MRGIYRNPWSTIQMFKTLCFLIGTLPFFGIGEEDTQNSFKPNIVWLVCEDSGTRWYGCYGNEYAETPNIDILARHGFRYTYCYANSAVCSSSRSAWITGMHAVSFGGHDHRGYVHLPEDAEPYFSERLKLAGYNAYNFGKTDYNSKNRNAKACWTQPTLSEPVQLAEKQPFFIQHNFMASHEGEIYHLDADSHYGDSEQKRQNPEEVKVTAEHRDTPHLRLNHALYQDRVNLLDKQIGEIVESYKKAGLEENTIFIFTSDHGGSLNRSKRTLYNSGTHCPFIIKIPEKFKNLWPEGRKPGDKIERLVSFLDMTKTWVSLSGGDTQGMHDRVILGPDSEPEPEYIFGWTGRTDGYPKEARSVRDKRYLYLRNLTPIFPSNNHYYKAAQDVLRGFYKRGDPRRERYAHDTAVDWQSEVLKENFSEYVMEEFYDTQADPANVHNLINDPAHAQKIAEMRQSLRSWQLEVYDCGLLPEAERQKWDADPTIYHAVRDAETYPLLQYLDLADLALAKDPKNLPTFLSCCHSATLGERYWAVNGILLLGEAANTPDAISTLKTALNDESHYVRIIAACCLIRLGQKQEADTCLLNLLDTQSYASLALAAIVKHGLVDLSGMEMAQRKQQCDRLVSEIGFNYGWPVWTHKYRVRK
ncbi:MAG: sulfatase-like hydrolase/transferase [Verrucomicrobiota bacterium]